MTEKTAIEVKRESAREVENSVQDWEPIRSLRHQIDRLFADFDWPDLRMAWLRRAAALPQPWPDFGAAVPLVDLVERNGGYELQAELPGLTENQIEVKLANGILTIKGEKSSERVEDQDDYHLRERSFGSFQRSFRVPANVDADKIDARFDKSVLKVSLPKTAAAIQEERKIDVKAA
ncbi:Hsp20/alpha crystallin family protein [Tabrizicola sp. WMC-M-20]|nr:Hsp20/alpha crystallin family protein [Tabrizicola sp. WMC-M-20]